MAPLDKLLRFLFVAPALVDLGMGFFVLIAPETVARMIRLTVPEPFYVWIIGLLQIGLALAYLVASRDPVRYINHVALGGLMRLAMAILLLVTGIKLELMLVIVLGVVEVFLGLSHLIFRLRLARSSDSTV
jgi:hypothetical protein